MRTAMAIIGLLATVMGLLFVGQGSGYFPYPASSFMIDQSPWILRGAVLAAIGVVLILFSRRWR